MATNNIDGDLFVNGTLGSTKFRPAAGSIKAASVENFTNVEVTKLRHWFRRLFATESGTVPADERHVLHVGRAQGNLVYVAAGAVDNAAGAATVWINLLRDGTSGIITSQIVLSAGQANYALITETILSAPYVAGDVFEADIIASAAGGTLPKGVFVITDYDEQYQNS